MNTKALFRPRNVAVSLAFAIASAVGIANAVPLPPGASGPTPGSSVAADPTLAGTILASQLLPFSCGGLVGTLDNKVIRNTLGQLDFYYYLKNATTSTVSIVDATAQDYAVSLPTVLDANFRTDMPGAVAPVTAARSGAPGSSVRWLFSGPNIPPGQDSRSFYARSGRFGFNAKGVTYINGGCPITGTYQPL